MSTTSTIGSASRNYSTVTAWLAAFANGGWIGNMYNDGEFNATNGETFPLTFNQATSASNYITLTTAAGQSFVDQGSAINHLRYDQANGVAITTSGYGKTVISSTSDYVTISKLQLQTTSTAGNCYTQSGNTPNSNCSYMLLDKGGTVGSGWCLRQSAGQTIRNVIMIMRDNISSSSGFNGGYYNHCTLVNCTAFTPSDKSKTSTVAFANHNTTNIKLVNCAGFGFAAFNDGSPTGSNNASDKTISFGTSNQASLTFANQFVGTTNSTIDVKLKAGSALIDNGTADTTDLPAANDIVGTARPQGSAWDIGAYEVPVATDNGTIAVTEQADTFAATVTHYYQGNIAVTEAVDVFAANLTHYYAGSIAVTEANDSFAASVTHRYDSSIAVTEANDSFAASASLQHNATIAVTEANDSFSASVTHEYVGTIAVTEANDSFSASVSLQHNATIAVTEQGDSFAASVTHKYVGTIAVTEQNDSLSGQVKHVRSFHINVTEDNDTSDAEVATGPLIAQFTFADLRNQELLDWGDAPYDSYFYTFQFAPDVSVKSQTPYIYTFIKEGSASNADSEGAFVRIHWDWSNDSVSKRTGPLEQVYKYHNGGLVGVSRQKVRGRGRTAQLEFRNDGQKNFNILGWTLYMQTNQGE